MCYSQDYWSLQALMYSSYFEHKKIKESGQKLTIDFSEQSYLKEISRARTFGYERDVEMLQKQNLALGASIDNAIALSDDDILNEDGMRYHNEFVKHKIFNIPFYK